jgi:tetratricopeptide (TPR) repeat protein
MRPRAALIAGLPLLLVATAAGFSADPAPGAPTYLVLPFENIAEERSLDWLSTGLALTLGEYLRGFGAQVVDDEERAVLLEGSGIPAGATLTLASNLELGRKMRARPGAARPNRIVLGRFNVSEGELTLSLRSIDLESEKAGPWLSRKGRVRDLLDVQNALTVALAKDERLGVDDGRSVVFAKQVGDLPLLAFETYCRAMAESNSKKRLHLLRRALEEYPGYPKAAYQAASLLAKGEHWEEASEMIRRTSGDPHPYESEHYLLFATIALQQRDPESAAKAARHALEFTDTARGHLLLARAHLALGDKESAQAEIDKAAALDPSEPEVAELRHALASGPAGHRRAH